jgi:excisionase family DNA binding protein
MFCDNIYSIIRLVFFIITFYLSFADDNKVIRLLQKSILLTTKFKQMEEKILSELQEIKQLAVLGAKQALTMNDAALLTGLSKSHLYKMVCAKKIPYWKGQGGKLTYFEKGELNGWMLQHRIKTADEIETEAANYTVPANIQRKGAVMFSFYMKTERRQSIKKDGTESKTPRYEATAQAGYFKPLESLKNAKGEIVMYCQRNEKCNPNSTAETRLQCRGGINFSSIYFCDLNPEETLIGYGEPPQTKELKGGRQNPFFDNRADGYLFIVTPSRKDGYPDAIEIITVPNGRALIRGYAAKLADGQLDEILNELRKSAII